MAPRKPNKSRRDKPNDSLANQVGGWLGGAAKGVYNYSESQARTFTNPYINAAGRVIGKNPNLPVSGAKEAITNTAWGVVDVASGPIGRVAAKGVTAAGTGAAKVAGKAVANVRAKVNPFYETVRAARSTAPNWAKGEATAEKLMKLRSADRFNFNSTVRTPPRIKDDTAHLANIRKQNKSSYEYENKTRLYSDEDLSNFSNLSEDIKTRGIQQPVTIGRIAGKPTLLEGNHRVIAQFDINPKAKVPFEVSQNTWDVVNKQTKDVARRTRAKVPKKK
jgi:hypothetical protein